MAKQLKFEFDNTDFCLEFTRKSIEAMEKQGFISSDITNKPVSTLPALFAGAFIARHRFVKRDVIDEIYAKMTNKEELIGKLADMYGEVIMALVGEPENIEGNVEWTANW